MGRSVSSGRTDLGYFLPNPEVVPMAPFDLDAYHEQRRSTDVGATVRYREQSGSTMDDARAGAEADEPCGSAYVAGKQSAGRGRQGRQWVSPLGAGLHVTYHLCPPKSDRTPLLSVAGALAAADAIRETSGLRSDLKWPNDVLYEGKKLCGVLAEARHGERLDVFLGIGINVRVASDMPDEVRAIATSIEQAGGAVPSLEALLAALSAALQGWTWRTATDPDGMVAEWRSRLVTLGQRVTLAAPAGEVTGEAVDVTDHGELVLRLDSGLTQSFSAGDVTTV